MLTNRDTDIFKTIPSRSVSMSESGTGDLDLTMTDHGRRNPPTQIQRGSNLIQQKRVTFQKPQQRKRPKNVMGRDDFHHQLMSGDIGFQVQHPNLRNPGHFVTGGNGYGNEYDIGIIENTENSGGNVFTQFNGNTKQKIHRTNQNSQSQNEDEVLSFLDDNTNDLDPDYEAVHNLGGNVTTDNPWDEPEDFSTSGNNNNNFQSKKSQQNPKNVSNQNLLSSDFVVEDKYIKLSELKAVKLDALTPTLDAPPDNYLENHYTNSKKEIVLDVSQDQDVFNKLADGEYLKLIDPIDNNDNDDTDDVENYSSRDCSLLCTKDANLLSDTDIGPLEYIKKYTLLFLGGVITAADLFFRIKRNGFLKYNKYISKVPLTDDKTIFYHIIADLLFISPKLVTNLLEKSWNIINKTIYNRSLKFLEGVTYDDDNKHDLLKPLLENMSGSLKIGDILQVTNELYMEDPTLNFYHAVFLEYHPEKYKKLPEFKKNNKTRMELIKEALSGSLFSYIPDFIDLSTGLILNNNAYYCTIFRSNNIIFKNNGNIFKPYYYKTINNIRYNNSISSGTIIDNNITSITQQRKRGISQVSNNHNGVPQSYKAPPITHDMIKNKSKYDNQNIRKYRQTLQIAYRASKNAHNNNRQRDYEKHQAVYREYYRKIKTALLGISADEKYKKTFYDISILLKRDIRVTPYEYKKIMIYLNSIKYNYNLFKKVEQKLIELTWSQDNVRSWIHKNIPDPKRLSNTQVPGFLKQLIGINQIRNNSYDHQFNQAFGSGNNNNNTNNNNNNTKGTTMMDIDDISDVDPHEKQAYNNLFDKIHKNRVSDDYNTYHFVDTLSPKTLLEENITISSLNKSASKIIQKTIGKLKSWKHLLSKNKFGIKVTKKFEITVVDLIRIILKNVQTVPRSFEAFDKNLDNYKVIVENYKKGNVSATIKFDDELLKELNIDSKDKVKENFHMCCESASVL